MVQKLWRRGHVSTSKVPFLAELRLNHYVLLVLNHLNVAVWFGIVVVVSVFACPRMAIA